VDAHHGRPKDWSEHTQGITSSRLIRHIHSPYSHSLELTDFVSLCLSVRVCAIFCQNKFGEAGSNYLAHLKAEECGRKAPCPNCKQSAHWAALPKHVAEDCQKVTVECSNKCGSKLLRGDLKSHGDTKCENAMVACKYAQQKCPLKQKRKDIGTHEKKCGFRPVECDFCHQTFPDKLMDAHVDKDCMEAQVTCECGAPFARKHLKEHQDQDCQHGQVKCKRCEEKLKRSEEDAHSASNAGLARHVNRLFELVESLQAELQSTKEELQLMKEAASAATEEVTDESEAGDGDHNEEQKSEDEDEAAGDQ
jgi:hypothetical protein